MWIEFKLAAMVMETKWMSGDQLGLREDRFYAEAG
jgi:hypothetical protein